MAAIILLVSTLLSLLITSAAVDTIRLNQTISDGNTIISAGGNFELGFFNPGNSKNRYLGIWYKKISTGTVVWVANRMAPLTNSSGLVRVGNRRIVLVNNISNNIIWSSNSSRFVTNPIAQLLDTGNLVLRDENDGDPENYLWQSFDYPGDTILPGMKLGLDLETGLERYMTPWKSGDDPSPGDFTHRMDPHGYPQLLLWQGSVVKYRVGPWIGSKPSGFPHYKPNVIYKSEFVLNQKEIFYRFEITNSSSGATSRLILTPTGDVQRHMWIVRTQKWEKYLTFQENDCDRYALCGSYGSCNINNSPACECLKGFNPKFQKNWQEADWYGGCIRRTQLDCGNGDGFVKHSGMKLPDTRHSWYNMSIDLDECKRVCLKNCSCTAYSSLDIRGPGSGCILWFDDLIDIRGDAEDHGQDLYVRMAASELDASGSRERRHLRIIVIPVLVVPSVLLGLFMIHLFKKRQGKLKLNSESNATKEKEREDMDLPLFDFIKIANATDNFSNQNKLGEGGFGPVYKGILDDGKEIAVKRLSKDSRQGPDEFKNEVSCIAKLQHRNLVRLLGCCIEEGERMLIYEYMPNKSLDSFIFDEKLSKFLDWPSRYNIINGIARGILYLHQDSRLRIIHRDLKASNILLDHVMNPRISDFGMARSFGETQTEANTTRVVGTYGYMPPEYAIDGLFSVKSDVFSFGVLVLEIVSGKKNRGFDHPGHNLNLLGHAWRLYEEDQLLELFDVNILESSNHDEVLRAIHIGLLCVQQYPEDRPSMPLVVLMFSSKIDLPNPKQPGFYTERKIHEGYYSTSSQVELLSSNQLSVTYFAPR